MISRRSLTSSERTRLSRNFGSKTTLISDFSKIGKKGKPVKRKIFIFFKNFPKYAKNLNFPIFFIKLINFLEILPQSELINNTLPKITLLARFRNINLINPIGSAARSLKRKIS